MVPTQFVVIQKHTLSESRQLRGLPFSFELHINEKFHFCRVTYAKKRLVAVFFWMGHLKPIKMYCCCVCAWNENKWRQLSMHLLPPSTQLSIAGIPILMKNLPPTLPGCGIRSLVKNYRWIILACSPSDFSMQLICNPLRRMIMR